MDAATVSLPPTLQLSLNLTDEQFFQLCQNNRELQFERTASGEPIIMPPTGGETGNRNFEITVGIGIWNKKYNLGKGFDSSTGFKLPNGANRSSDASWVKQERWEALTPQQKQKFIPLCPDFVVELPSPNDSLKQTQLKMQEYIDNGARLGWLIDAKTRRVEIYRPDRTVELLENPVNLSGEEVLPGFVLDISAVLS
ncbi:Uma2 family endonuclease [Synechocystis sp. PCC 7509]|uniref:Uma2 family endonuclease n=1 Tax=Synechocystis sp. PCC 7509 TaxID=927677 RepID=UPI0002ACB802|nr:Uma2 family endonuclease [Synechocystis sp. PCC 7509]